MKDYYEAEGKDEILLFIFPETEKWRRKKSRKLVWALALAAGLLLGGYALAHEHGQPKAWFGEQKNANKALCCDGDDVYRVPDEDWGIKGQKYWVKLFGVVYDLEDWQLVKPTSPNPTGSALVWYVVPEYGVGPLFIRCFIPGVEA